MATRANTEKMEHEGKKDEGVGEDGVVQAVQKGEKGDAETATDCTSHWDDEEHSKTGQAEYKKFQEAEARKRSENAISQPSGSAEHQGEETKKRGRGANQSVPAGTLSKKQKNTNTDGPKGTAGDKTRVPTKDQTVRWHAVSGYVEGTVVEVVYEERQVDGISDMVKGSKEDPRIVIKSSSSGKIAVHKPEAVYFD